MTTISSLSIAESSINRYVLDHFVDEDFEVLVLVLPRCDLESNFGFFEGCIVIFDFGFEFDCTVLLSFLLNFFILKMQMSSL